MRRQVSMVGTLNCGVVSERALMLTERVDYVTFQADVCGSTAWSSAVLTVKLSNNGDKWYGVPAGAVTMSAEGVTAVVDVFGYRYACLEVTTAQSNVQVRVSAYGEGISEGERPMSNVAAGQNIGSTAGGVGGMGGGGIGGAEGIGGGGSSS